MPILIDNIQWMSLNLGLAFLGLLFGFLMSSKNRVQRLVFFILWFLFVPNTIYLVTDMQYLPPQLPNLSPPEIPIALLQYAVVFVTGIVTYYLSIHFFEKLLSQYFGKSTSNVLIVFMNYLIAFAIFLGKVERVNSWTVFTQTHVAINSGVRLLGTSEILVAIFLLGTIISGLYFVLKKVLRPQ